MLDPNLTLVRKQSPRSCDPCCLAEANEDVTLIITPPISRSDILLILLLDIKALLWIKVDKPFFQFGPSALDKLSSKLYKLT